MDKYGFRAAGVLVAASLALLTGCAAAKKERLTEQDLDRIVSWLPGTYDNTLQAKADAQKGVQPPHDAVELVVVPLGSISIGRNAFYMQEMAADDPRRVLSQKVVIFSVGKKGITESLSTLVEPLQWRDGQRDPDMFMAMTPKDLKTVQGCDLTWKIEPDPKAADKKLSKEEARKARAKAKFVGASDPKDCKTTSHVVMGLVDVEYRGELTSNEFASGELQYDSSGKLIVGSTDESAFYRFRKTGAR